MALLDVRDLRTAFHIRGGVVRAVDGVSFRIAPSACVALTSATATRFCL